MVQFAIIGGFTFIAIKALPLAGGYAAISQTFAAAGKPGAMGIYGLASRIALLVALAIAFVITLFVGDVIAYFQKVVGSLLPGVGVTMLFVPSFAEWVRLAFGGPAIPSTAIALAAGVITSLLTPRSTADENERAAAVFAAREGR